MFSTILPAAACASGTDLKARAAQPRYPVSCALQSSASCANAAEVNGQLSEWKITPPQDRGSDRVGQGTVDQFGAQVIGPGEPDDAAGGDVDDGGSCAFED